MRLQKSELTLRIGTCDARDGEAVLSLPAVKVWAKECLGMMSFQCVLSARVDHSDLNLK